MYVIYILVSFIDNLYTHTDTRTSPCPYLRALTPFCHTTTPTKALPTLQIIWHWCVCVCISPDLISSSITSSKVMIPIGSPTAASLGTRVRLLLYNTHTHEPVHTHICFNAASKHLVVAMGRVLHAFLPFCVCARVLVCAYVCMCQDVSACVSVCLCVCVCTCM